MNVKKFNEIIERKITKEKYCFRLIFASFYNDNYESLLMKQNNLTPKNPRESYLLKQKQEYEKFKKQNVNY